MNKQLLHEVQRDILAHPAAFDVLDLKSDILAFAVKAAGRDPIEADTYVEARELLRITADQRDALSHLHLWPRRFRCGFNVDAANKADLKANARLATQRIEYFIREDC